MRNLSGGHIFFVTLVAKLGDRDLKVRSIPDMRCRVAIAAGPLKDRLMSQELGIQLVHVTIPTPLWGELFQEGLAVPSMSHVTSRAAVLFHQKVVSTCVRGVASVVALKAELTLCGLQERCDLRLMRDVTVHACKLADWVVGMFRHHLLLLVTPKADGLCAFWKSVSRAALIVTGVAGPRGVRFVSRPLDERGRDGCVFCFHVGLLRASCAQPFGFARLSAILGSELLDPGVWNYGDLIVWVRYPIEEDGKCPVALLRRFATQQPHHHPPKDHDG